MASGPSPNRVDLCCHGHIAVEPYGSVTSRGEARRISKNDFYTLLQKWLKDEEISVIQQHYVIATLIRGGVFGGNE